MNYLNDVAANVIGRVGFRGNPPTPASSRDNGGRATLTTATYGVTTVGSPAPGKSTYSWVRTARIRGGAEKIRGMPNMGGRPNNGDSATSLPKSTTKTCWTLGAMSPEWEAEAWEATKARCKRGDNPHTNRNTDNHNPVRDRGGQSRLPGPGYKPNHLPSIHFHERQITGGAPLGGAILRHVRLGNRGTGQVHWVHRGQKGMAVLSM